MVQGASEIAAVCVGLIGLIGASATTGMPMWKVTAFIGANIIVMETRWEGLWMNCYRQANIRMQCKVYDSVLYLPPELQAARGLMCCSLALSGVGLLVALAGMRCITCFQGTRRDKTMILMVAGGMQFLACICVLIPVSWTGNVIIRDFYNPLLIDAQRSELGEALYIGWVTSGFLFVSAMLFVCRQMPSEKGSYNVYCPDNLMSYKPQPRKRSVMSNHPISNVSSLQSTAYQPSLPIGSIGQLATAQHNIPQVMRNDGALKNSPFVYNTGLPENASLLYQGAGYRSSIKSSSPAGSLFTSGNSLYIRQNTMPYSPTYTDNPTPSYQSSFYPVPHTPVFVGYKASRIQPNSHSESSGCVYI